jgi:[ribosomal protein S5]-alanine N-acetyltransferase
VDFVVTDEEGLAGIVSLAPDDRALGYWFAPRAHGRGYATEAARAVLAAKLAEDPASVKSGYFEGNSRSANVLRKLGFVETGRFAKHCRALGRDRPHVDMAVTYGNFVDSLPIEARSARLAYRSMQATDAAALHGIVTQEAVVRQLYSWPWPPDADFTLSRAAPYRGDGFAWGIFREGRLIGTVAVTDGELGYFLAPEAWGLVYAGEACRVAIATAFAAGRDHLTAGVWADNAASLRLLGKLGFRIVGDDRAFAQARQAETPGHLLRLDRADWGGA